MECPKLDLLKYQHIQTKVDKRIRELYQCSHTTDEEPQKLKSLRSGGVDTKCGGFMRPSMVGYPAMNLV